MNVLECKPSERITKLEILKGRIPEFHPKWVEVIADLKDQMAGYEGEKSLQFYLDILPDKDYYILYGLRLKYKNYYFQIDCLVLCSKFGLVLEAKKWTGDFCFDNNFNQMTVIRRKGKIRRKNPVLQAKLQAKKLKCWLEEHDCPDIPIHYLFVNTNESSEIISDEPIRNACNSEVLLDKINQLVESYKIDTLETKDLRKMQKLLLANHTPESPDLLKEFNISQNEIPTGVICPECKSLPMKYRAGYWCCLKCGHKSKTAHYQAIQDYFHLIKPFITNRELRKFLHINSIKVASKILTSLNLPSTGTFKDRVYHLQSPPHFPLNKKTEKKFTPIMHKNLNNNKK